MCHLPHISLRLASVIAVVVFLSAWNSNSNLDLGAQTRGAASAAAANNAKTSDSKTGPVANARTSSSYGKLPISFEINQGQTDKSVQFLARSSGYTLFLTPGEAVLSLHSAPPKAARRGAPVPAKPPAPLADIVRMQLIGANTRAEAAGVDPLPGKSNYFTSDDPAKWHTDVPTYAKVRYSNVYPGIDLLYYGNQEGRLEHDFVVAPGADSNAIGIALRSSDAAVPDQNGGLTLRTKTGDLALRSPVAYQTIDGRRKTITATYVLADNNEIRFRLGRYDRNAPLVIDPVIEYIAVFGSTGLGLDDPMGIAVDRSGNVYVTGWNNGGGFPLVNALQESCEGNCVFISKINAAGTALIYSTFLSGRSGNGIAVDDAGRAYVAGTTGPALPLKNAYQSTYGGGNSDAFLSVLGPEGDTLVYSTFLGGPSDDFGDSIALDSSRNAYVVGSTSVGFPTLHSIQTEGDVFAAKFDGAGALQYSSVFGNTLVANAMATDMSGSVYVTGNAEYETSPAPTKGAFQSSCPSHSCAFVAKLRPTGERLDYFTYLGNNSIGYGIGVDSSGEAYVAGDTTGKFPVTKNAFQKTFKGVRDGFVSKLNSTGTGLIWSTYLGGSGLDSVTSMALDRYRTVYVAGFTNSKDFPLKASVQSYAPPRQSADGQGFVTTLSGDLSSIVYYSTYFGPSPNEQCLTTCWIHVLAIDKALNVYIGGQNDGSIRPTPGAFSNSSTALFFSKLVIMDDLSLALSASPTSVAHGANLTYTIAVASKGPDFGSNVRISDTLPSGTTFVSYSAGGGKCTAPAAGATGTLNCVLPELEKGHTWDVTLTVKVNAAAGTTLSNTAATISNMQDFEPGNNSGTITTHVTAPVD